MNVLLTLLNKSIYWLLLVAGIFGASSCSHYYYAPNESLMTFSERGDVKINAGIGSRNGDQSYFNRLADPGRKRKNYNIQAGGSPFRNVGVQGSFFHLRDIGLDEYNSNLPSGGDGHIGEFAVGYYRSINKQSPAFQKGQIWLMDFYAGGGWGQVNNYYAIGGESHLDFTRQFIHAGIHFEYKKNILLSFTCRTVRLNYNNADLYGRVPEREVNSIEDIQQINPIYMVEPGFRFQMGIRQVKFYLSSTFTASTTNTSRLDAFNDFNYINSIGNIGIIIEPDEFFRKKK